MSWSAQSIRQQYSRFLDNEDSILFANHSHQAWPNVAKFGQLRAFELAADLHGSKWGEVEKAREFLRSWISKRIGNESFGGAKGICWGQSTYEHLCSFLSALDLKAGDVIISSNTEFHSMRRLLLKLEEDGVRVLRIPTWTREELRIGQTSHGFFDRMTQEILKLGEQNKVKAIMFSSVSYLTGSLLPDFYEGLTSLLLRKIPVLVDLYHHIGPVDFQVPSIGEEYLYLVGGGYKYLQMGEGNAWLRAPISCELRPRNTGWFAEFSILEEKPGELLSYPEGAERFRGATYEPSSILRAYEVAKFFDGIGMDRQSLQKKYREDVTRIYERVERLLVRLDSTKKEKNELYLVSHKVDVQRAGFVALHFKESLDLHSFLLKNFVETDYRGEVIRFGPAPYTLGREIDRLLDLLTEYFDRL